MDGILNLNKPAGITSFKAVSKVRRIAGVDKVGHAGTLDPFATGVLPVMLGKATRVAEYCLDHAKTYRAQITLGNETDTLDITGNIIATAETTHITLQLAESVIGMFTGVIQQIPPVFSALKLDGRRMYQMAREGLNPEPASRSVSIYKLQIISFQLPILTIDVTCSRGTYIRSLARDIGLALKSRGYLSKLERTEYGPLDIASSVCLDDIDEQNGEDLIKSNLLPLDTVLGHLSAINLTQEEAGLVANGGSIYRQDMPGTGNTWRAYDENGSLAALLVSGQAPDWYKPRKVFVGASQP
ncbi:MAG: tRNA pseudouridine(55) synthase TruB [Dehalococcoidales bacterium]|nr:tRNA pseudouridine(55) synthase TruB [Dehalococcoidales bacterium]MDD5604819.1 tRNA pseudouridine(55) synthase TruB [Dehalococcoidales bacterium]MDX9985952.1 tRNA pseudouridine(55) synthase TruB [Dehalococcoidales bacterium]NLE89465.1 tRNA pseudouridine(55) synthase TruB [Dehalococcoidales bacterium]